MGVIETAKIINMFERLNKPNTEDRIGKKTIQMTVNGHFSRRRTDFLLFTNSGE